MEKFEVHFSVINKMEIQGNGPLRNKISIVYKGFSHYKHTLGMRDTIQFVIGDFFMKFNF